MGSRKVANYYSGAHMKTLRMLAAVALATMMMVGCATTENYEKMLNSWVGAQELDLVRRWGAPTQSYEAAGRKFVTYSSSRNIFIPGTAPTYTTTLVGNTAYTNRVGGTSAQNIGMSCQTTFEIYQERVVSWRHAGNDCRAFDR